MKHICLFFIVLMFCSQSVVAGTERNWKEMSANEIGDLLSYASSLDETRVLALSELKSVIGQYNYVETQELLFPKKVWAYREGRDVPLPTQELVWLLSNGRRLQAIIAESVVTYAYVIDGNKKMILVWK